MPSAAKKRKAAKKKKEKEAIINPSTNNHQGNDDLKSQDEKGSDGGEVSSPASHDHDEHHHSFNEGNKEVEEKDPSAAQTSIADIKSIEEVLPSDIKSAEVVERKEDSVVEIERELKSEESSDSKNVYVESTNSAEESYYKNKNSSSTSNDESLSEKNSKDEPYNSIHNSIQGATTFEYLVKSADSSLAQMTLINENTSAKETGNSVMDSSVNSVEAVSSMSGLKSSDTGSALAEKSVVAQVGAADLAMKRNDDKVYPFSDKNIRTSSLEEPKPKEYHSKAPTSSSGSPFTESTTGEEHTKDSDTPECSENKPSATRLVQKTSWLSCCGLFEVLSGSNR